MNNSDFIPPKSIKTARDLSKYLIRDNHDIIVIGLMKDGFSYLKAREFADKIWNIREIECLSYRERSKS